jgi:hypothetical protein
MWGGFGRETKLDTALEIYSKLVMAAQGHEEGVDLRARLAMEKERDEPRAIRRIKVEMPVGGGRMILKKIRLWFRHASSENGPHVRAHNGDVVGHPVEPLPKILE